jgi:hypothetical protein
MRQMASTEIVINIERRLREAQQEIASLEAARAALLDGASASPRPANATRRAKPARPKTTRPEVVPVGKLTNLLDGSPGMTTRELARHTNGVPAQILRLLKEQEASGQVRRTGVKAATRWHLITDEDRIATRAAELTARRAKR